MKPLQLSQMNWKDLVRNWKILNLLQIISAPVI